MSALRKLRAARAQQTGNPLPISQPINQPIVEPTNSTSIQSSLKESSDDDEPEPINQSNKPQNLFSQLNDQDENDSENESEDEVDLQSIERSIKQSMKQSVKPKPKNKSKQSVKQAKSQSVKNDIDDDDLDAVLAEISQQDNQSLNQSIIGSEDKRTEESSVDDWKVLSINQSNLDASNEIRARFGSSALRGARDEEKQSINRSTNRRHRPVKRQRLVRVGNDWPPVVDKGELKVIPATHHQSVSHSRPSTGLVPIQSTSQPINQSNSQSSNQTTSRVTTYPFSWHCSGRSCPLYEFSYSDSYARLQSNYAQVVASHDVQSIIHFNRQHPYHLDSCAQMAEIAESQGEFLVAQTFVARALHFIDLSLSFDIYKSINRFDCLNDKNRILFTLLAKQAQMLAKKSCARTALEVAKLTLSFSPLIDPSCMMCLIDYYALRSQQYAWLIDFPRLIDYAVIKQCGESPWPITINQPINVPTLAQWIDEQQTINQSVSQPPRPPASFMPNLMYSRALAAFHLDGSTVKPCNQEEGPIELPMINQSINQSTNQSTNQSNNPSRLLCLAIAVYPECVAGLLEHSGRMKDVSPSNQSINQLKSLHPTNVYVDKLVTIFTERCAPLWKQDSHHQFLMQNIDCTLRLIDSGLIDMSLIRLFRTSLFPPNCPVPRAIRDLQRTSFTDTVTRLPPELLLAQAEARDDQWIQRLNDGEAIDYRQLPAAELRRALDATGMQLMDPRGQNPLVALLRSLMPNVVVAPNGQQQDVIGEVDDVHEMLQMQELLHELEQNEQGDEWNQVDDQGEEEDLGEH